VYIATTCFAPSRNFESHFIINFLLSPTKRQLFVLILSITGLKQLLLALDTIKYRYRFVNGIDVALTGNLRYRFSFQHFLRCAVSKIPLPSFDPG
jgi:hypothetical protein